VIALALAASLAATPATQRTAPAEPDVVEKLGESVAVDVVLTAENGEKVRVGDLLDGKHPVILTLGYFRCEQLCSVVLRGQMEAMKASALTLGEDYVSLTVSIAPEEDSALAAERQTHWLRAFGRPDATASWRFLTGDAASLRALADSVGFGYERDPDSGVYLHPAGLVVLSPDGRVSRYLYGVRFPTRDVRLAVVEAAEGRAGTSFDRVLLTCFKWDPATRRYQLFVSRFLKTGGALVLAFVGCLLGVLWRRELRR
jgi:protein SCO1